MPTVPFVTVLLLVPLLRNIPTTYAEIYTVDWKIPGIGQSLSDMTATVGDTAVFEWSFFHNVLIHPSGDCVETGAISVGSSSGASYTFTADDVGEMVFACDVGNHCENGQIMTFTVSAATTPSPTAAPVATMAAPVVTSAATDHPSKQPSMEPSRAPSKAINEESSEQPSKAPTEGQTESPTKAPSKAPTKTLSEDTSEEPSKAPTTSPTPPPTAAKKVDADVVIEWSVPSNGEPLPAKTAEVGDVVRFDWKWKGAHNVYVHPSGDCNETDAVLVGDESVTTAAYTFTEKDAGKDVVFACDVSSHCENGQIVTFSVSSNEDPGEKSGGVSFGITGVLLTLLSAITTTGIFF